MRLGPLEFTWKKKGVPAFLLGNDNTGWWLPTKQGPKSAKEALTSVVGWAFACIDAIASRAASIPYHLYSGDEPVERHIFYDIWNKPNDVFPAWHMRYLLFAHLKAAGKAYWYLYDSNLTNPLSGRGLPREVWPLDPTKVDRDFRDGTVRYAYRANHGKVDLDPDRVLEFVTPNPSNMYDGWSPLRAVGIPMDISEFIDGYQWNWFRNGAWYPYALQTDMALPEGAPKRIRDEWMQTYGPNSGRNEPVILHSGLRAESAPMGADLGLTALDEAARDKVLGAFRTPRSKVGYSEAANKASMLAADIAWNAEVIQPLLVLVDSVLDQKWLPIYGQGSRLTGAFDSPIPTDQEDLRADVQLMVSQGLITDNEARQLMGLEPIEGGDERYKPFSVMPASNIRPGGSRASIAGPKAGMRPSDEMVADARTPGITKSFWTDERKDSHWMTYDKRLTRDERRWPPVMKRLFDLQEEDVWEAVKRHFGILSDAYEGWSRKKVAMALTKDSRLDDIDQTVMSWTEEFTSKGKEVMTGIYDSAGASATALVGGPDFDLQNPRAARWLEQRSVNFATLVNQTTAQQVRQELSDALMEGESIDEMSERLAALFDRARDYRADRIARTETHASVNAGQFDGYSQAGVQYKAWMSARDGSVRDEHVVLDAEYSEDNPIPMTEPFRVSGYAAMFPGEFGAPEQDINCRCATIPIISED